MKRILRLENGGGSKSRRNEQVARSEAECQRCGNEHDACLSRKIPWAGDGEGGGGSHQPRYPSFLVHNKGNVNSQIRRAKGLLAMWDFLEYKGRIGMTQIILQKKEEYSTLKIMPATCRSRYFGDGR